MVSSGVGACRRPPCTTVRPTSDRVREAIFDILFSLGGVDGLLVADLFAGSGAMGIEALSRGAASVTFVDRSPEALAAVRANLASVGLADAERDGDATVVRADATPGRRPPPRATTWSCAIPPTTTTDGKRWWRRCRPIWPSSNPAARSLPLRGGGSSKPSGMGVRS